MSRVKKSTSRKPGTAVSSSSTDQQALKGTKMISAVRGKVHRNFNYLVWNSLPPDKDGWKEVEGKPSDLSLNTESANSAANTPTSKQIEASAHKAAFEAYVLAFGKDPSGMSVEEMNEAVAEKEDDDEGDEIEHIVTQEDLDTNPELAKSGVKVGEPIMIKKGETE